MECGNGASWPRRARHGRSRAQQHTVWAAETPTTLIVSRRTLSHFKSVTDSLSNKYSIIGGLILGNCQGAHVCSDSSELYNKVFNVRTVITRSEDNIKWNDKMPNDLSRVMSHVSHDLPRFTVITLHNTTPASTLQHISTWHKSYTKVLQIFNTFHSPRSTGFLTQLWKFHTGQKTYHNNTPTS